MKKSTVRIINRQSLATLTQVQDEYIGKLNAARAKATSYKQRSAIRMTEARAYKTAMEQLAAMGFSRDQAYDAMRDARDMADLMVIAQS